MIAFRRNRRHKDFTKSHQPERQVQFSYVSFLILLVPQAAQTNIKLTGNTLLMLVVYSMHAMLCVASFSTE